MQPSAQFRLLGDDTSWLDETMAQVYVCAERFRKLAVLCPKSQLLDDVDERLWQHATENFVSFAYASESESSDVNVLLTTSLDRMSKRPAVINLGGEITPDSLTMQYLCEIVMNDDQAVAKAREQYKMYRQHGFNMQHLELTSTNP